MDGVKEYASENPGVVAAVVIVAVIIILLVLVKVFGVNIPVLSEGLGGSEIDRLINSIYSKQKKLASA